MAVSKHQNERPAIDALIDLANQLEGESNTHARNIETLTEGLADEVSDREAADTRLEESIESETTARQQAVQGVQNQIGDGFAQTSITTSLSETNRAVQGIDGKIGDGLFSSDFTITQGYQESATTLVTMNRDIATLQNWQDRFRLGLTTNVTVVAGSSTSGTQAFATPFDSGADVAVFPVCVDASGNFTDLSCKLVSADYAGFSFAVYNDTQADVTVKVGFLAVRVD